MRGLSALNSLYFVYNRERKKKRGGERTEEKRKRENYDNKRKRKNY